MEIIDNEVFYNEHDKMIISNIIDDYDDSEIECWLDSLIKNLVIKDSEKEYYLDNKQEALNLLNDNNCFDIEVLQDCLAYENDPLGFYGMKDSDFLSY